MAPSIATVKITDNTVLPLRIFVNRKQLLQKSSSETVFHTPLLSNNSIVYIKSPFTKIYLSNHDMHDLCYEIKTELLIIVYDLSSQFAVGKAFGNLRIGQTSDYQANYVTKQFIEDSTDQTTSRIETITRVDKNKYKLHYSGNWELDIYINNVKKLDNIRSFLLFKEQGVGNAIAAVQSKRKVLLRESVTKKHPLVLQEEDDAEDVNDEAAAQDEKPELAFKYRPVTNLGECIDIHILHRPKRQRQAPRNQ